MRIFVTHILPKEVISKYKLSVAACNFSYNLIEGGVFTSFFSILPIYVNQYSGDMQMDGLVYSNWRRKKGLLRWIGVIHENYKIFKKIPSGSKVWFYNLTILNLFLYLLVRYVKQSSEAYIILLDYTPGNSFYSKLCLYLANHATGTIRLAESSLYYNSNSICLPGVTPTNSIKTVQQNVINNEYLLSGVLSERIAMISMVLEAFSRMPDKILHITGSLEDESVLKKYVSCDNIIYHGQVSFSEYLKILEACSFQLSTRDENYPENKCNFPSKIIEALLHNRIVISTLEYPQLGVIKYYKVSQATDKFIEDIKKICETPTSELLMYANQGQKVAKMFNTDVWSKAMEKIEKADDRDK